MKLLTIFSLVLVLATVSCLNLKSPRIVVPAIKHPQAENANKKLLPYHVGLLLKSSDSDLIWCGGSLIGHEWVLTAAHCIEDVEEATVYLGASQRKSPEVTHKVKKENFIIHADWDSEDIKNDISLIKIPFTNYSEKIQPVKLPALGTSNSTYEDEAVITSGWRQISDPSAGFRNDLDWSSMNVVRNDLCRDYFGWVIIPSNICISTYGLASNCRGDDGGPLVLESSMQQIGVYTFSSRNGCEKGIPLVFTRVTDYLTWIKSNTGVSY